MLAPEAFGGPSPARPGADMEAGSVKTRSYPRISTLVRGLHKCDYLDRLHFSEKNFFYPEVWWAGVLFFISNFSILEVSYAWVWLYRVVGFAIAVSGDFRGLPVVVGLFLTD